MSRILVFTNDRVSQVLFRQDLSLGFHETVCSDDMSRLFDLIESERPDLVITDDDMPGVGGAMAQQAIDQRVDYPLPVIVCTRRKVRPDPSRHPLLAFCSKPVETRELLGLVRASLRKAKLMQPVGA